MEFDIIKASKLYKASPRKKKIYSSFKNSINMQLVEQPIASVNPEDLEPVVDEMEREEQESKAKHAKEENSEDKPKSKKPSSGPKHSAPTSRPSGSSDMGGGEENDPTPSDSKSSEAPEPSEDVESSDEAFNRAEDLANETVDIKGLLNLREDTSGVNYITEKQKDGSSELWIYYNDDINLNNVMGTVIELLNSSNYRYLQFNRLARSDNAMVFIILHDGLQTELKPDNEVVEEVVKEDTTPSDEQQVEIGTTEEQETE